MVLRKGTRLHWLTHILSLHTPHSPSFWGQPWGPYWERGLGVAAGKYHFSGSWVVPALPSWRRPPGPVHRIWGSACSVAGAPWSAGLCRQPADETGTAELQCCARTQAPGTCMCYQPGNSGRPRPMGEAEHQHHLSLFTRLLLCSQTGMQFSRSLR